MGRKEWSSGICQYCCQFECCCACLFPCIYFGNNIEKMERLQIPLPEEIDLISFHGSCPKSTCGCVLYAIGWLGPSINVGISSATLSFLFNALELFPLYLHTKIRSSIRKQYKIEPVCCDCCHGQCDDFCCVLCCYSCALTQEYGEMCKIEEENNPSTVATYTLMPAIENSQLISIHIKTS